MRIIVFGNCQARPLADYLQKLVPEIEVAAVHIVHLMKEEDRSAVEDSCRSADWIFAQQVNDKYPVPFVRSQVLKEQFGDRVLLWPNLFFKGQTPDLCYITSANGQRVVGPLAHYHCRSIYEAWSKGTSVQATHSGISYDNDLALRAVETAQGSMAEFVRREQSCDVSVCGFIEEAWRERRLFYTFNHPVGELLLQVAVQLLRRSGSSTPVVLTPAEVGDPLHRLGAPTWPLIAEALKLKFPTSTITRGYEVVIDDKGVNIKYKDKTYEMFDMIELSFRCYDSQKELFENCRLT